MIKDLEDLEDLENNNQNNDLAIKENLFVKKSDLKNNIKNKGGRPKKSDEDKATEQIFVNLTTTEKEKVDSFAKSIGISNSSLVKLSLNRFGVF